MNNDLRLIVHKFDKDLEELHIYPIGDTQIGSAHFNQTLCNSWLKRVENDPLGKIVIVGDMLNNGLKCSKTNVYKEVMNPEQAKEQLYSILLPVKDKILGVVTGNHELRSVNETSSDPLKDVLWKLGLENLYNENLTFLKINFGKNTHSRQSSYTMLLAHGVSKTKTENFAYTVDGLDIMVTGHIHSPKSSFPAKIVIDSRNELVSLVGFTHIVVPSFDQFGGYTARGLYSPQDSTKIPMIILSGKEKKVEVLWIQERFY